MEPAGSFDVAHLLCRLRCVHAVTVVLLQLLLMDMMPSSPPSQERLKWGAKCNTRRARHQMVSSGETHVPCGDEYATDGLTFTLNGWQLFVGRSFIAPRSDPLCCSLLVRRARAVLVHVCARCDGHRVPLCGWAGCPDCYSGEGSHVALTLPSAHQFLVNLLQTARPSLHTRFFTVCFCSVRTSVKDAIDYRLNFEVPLSAPPTVVFRYRSGVNILLYATCLSCVWRFGESFCPFEF